MFVCVFVQVSVIASVEVELEAAIEKCKGAEKELARSLRELGKAIAAEQTELKKYQPGGKGLTGVFCLFAGLLLETADLLEGVVARGW
jgi:hypothetical protein